MYVSVLCVQAHDDSMIITCKCKCLSKPEKCLWFIGAGIRGSCELSYVGAGNLTKVLYKSSKCSEPQNHLSSPPVGNFNKVIVLHELAQVTSAKEADGIRKLVPT